MKSPAKQQSFFAHSLRSLFFFFFFFFFSFLLPLSSIQVIVTAPTIGFNVETVQYKKLDMTVWDIGGQDLLRKLWRHYYENVDAVVYIVGESEHYFNL